jgi:hypothetical protein
MSNDLVQAMPDGACLLSLNVSITISQFVKYQRLQIINDVIFIVKTNIFMKFV